MSPLTELRQLVSELGAAHGIDAGRLTVRTTSNGDGTPHFEEDGAYLSHLISERGEVRRRDIGLSPREAAFFLFFEATRQAASQQDLANRGAGYSRWNWMAPHIAMMGAIDTGWGMRTAQHYREVLNDTPLSDEEIAATRAENGLPGTP